MTQPTRPKPTPARRPRHQRRPGAHPMPTITAIPTSPDQIHLPITRWATQRRQADLDHLHRSQPPPWRPLRRRRHQQLLTNGQAELNHHLAALAARQAHTDPTQPGDDQ